VARDIKSADDTRPSTLDRYHQVVRRHLIPGLQTSRLEKLSARDVQQFFTARQVDLSAGSIAKIHAVTALRPVRCGPVRPDGAQRR